jgi:predicted nuclease of predicted toxin-antitoxin system
VNRISLLLDEQVSHAVAQALRRRAIDVLTAGEAGLLGAPDADYLASSRNTSQVLVTHDSDFLRLHQEQEHVGIAYCE